MNIFPGRATTAVARSYCTKLHNKVGSRRLQKQLLTYMCMESGDYFYMAIQKYSKILYDMYIGTWLWPTQDSWRALEWALHCIGQATKCFPHCHELFHHQVESPLWWMNLLTLRNKGIPHQSYCSTRQSSPMSAFHIWESTLIFIYTTSRIWIRFMLWTLCNYRIQLS